MTGVAASRTVYLEVFTRLKEPHMTTAEPTHRRTLTVVALVASILLKLVSVLVWPDQTGSVDRQLATSAIHPDAWAAASLLDLAASLALVTGVFGIARLLRGRGATLAAVGSTLAVLLVLGDTVSTAINLVEVKMAQQPGRAQMVALYHSFSHSPLVTFIAFILLGGIGVVLVALAFVRAGQASRWLMLPAGAALALTLAEGTRLGNLIQLVALGTCLLWMARRLSSTLTRQHLKDEPPRPAPQLA
jgi:hypothetical protein